MMRGQALPPKEQKSHRDITRVAGLQGVETRNTAPQTHFMST